MSVIVKSAIMFMARKYQENVAASVAQYGLKYQDLLIERDDVNKALARIDAGELQAREQRIKRAFDASAKRKFLPKENQTKDPLDFYLDRELSYAERDRQEREILNRY